MSTADITPNVPYNVYIVAFDTPDFFAYEASLSGVPTGTTFALSTTYNGPAPLDVGQPAAYNYIVGAGGCVTGGGAQALITVQYLSVVAPPQDTFICVGGSSPSSFGGAPGYAECDETTVAAYDLADGGCAIMNSTGPISGLPARIRLDDVEGEIGDLVTMPVRIGLSTVGRSDPDALAGIDLELAFDSSIAVLEDVRLSSATSNWYVEFNATGDAADIAAAAASGSPIPGPGDDVFLYLDFRAVGPEGFTTVDITSSRLFDIDQEPIEHNTAGGTIVVDCEDADPINDDEINTADAIRTLLAAVGLIELSPLEFCAADVDDNGVVEVADAILVLQAAVGTYDPNSSKVPTPPSDPSVYIRAGDIAGEMLLYFDDAAGLDAVMTYDPALVGFRSASMPDGGRLLASNGANDGVVRLGVAGSENGAGVVSLRFDVLGDGAAVNIHGITAYDDGAKAHALEVSVPEFEFGVTGVNGTPGLGRAVEILGAYPNPFNPRTQIEFRLAAPGDARIALYDVAGRLVRDTLRGGLDSGQHTWTWNGLDRDGRRVASGVYHVVVESAGQSARGRVTLLK